LRFKQSATIRAVASMFALPLKADIGRRQLDVRFVPKAAVSTCDI
jgi:hypothetical protein